MFEFDTLEALRATVFKVLKEKNDALDFIWKGGSPTPGPRLVKTFLEDKEHETDPNRRYKVSNIDEKQKSLRVERRF